MDAPPPPIISAKSFHPKAFKHLEEQGEAEMEMDSSDEDTQPPAASATSSFDTKSQFETIPLQLPVPTRVPVLNYHLTQYQSQQDWQWPPRVQLPPPVLHIPQVSTPETTPSQEQQEKPVDTLDNIRKSLPAWLR